VDSNNPQAAITSAGSALFAWQLVSVTATGTPFKGKPCATNNPYDMTCLVPDMLNQANIATYASKLTSIGLNPTIVNTILRERNGCAANFDTHVAHEHIKTYWDALVTAKLNSIASTASDSSAERIGIDDEQRKTELTKAESHMFAWQLGGIIRDQKFYYPMCYEHFEHLKSGLDLVGMDVASFTDLFCGQFLDGGLPSSGTVVRQLQLVLESIGGEEA
jgi:hypothetical protein